MNRFPKDILWGAASSAYQIEGYPTADGGGRSVWDEFCSHQGHISKNENGNIACDAYHRFEEDLDILQQIGLRAYRFSTSWARIDPLGDGCWNKAGLDYYDRVVDACLMRGIEPYVTLHHWELPQALEDQGGWLNRETPDAFARFAGMCASHFGSRVRNYFTTNEMQIILKLGYAEGIHAPGKKLPTEDLIIIWKHLLLAHGLAMAAVKSAAPHALVGLASTGRVCYPATESEADRNASRQAMFRLDNDWMFTHTMALDPICLGTLENADGRMRTALAEAINPEEMRIIHAVPDYLGINIYNGNEIRAGADGKPCYVPRPTGFPCTALKWPITPKIMRDGIVDIWKRYQLPVYITENGLSCNDKIYLDGKVHDLDRIDFLTRYLDSLAEAVPEADIRGYFHWSLTDNFEWHSGYDDRFGLIYIDYETQRRVPKDSAAWFSEYIKS